MDELERSLRELLTDERLDVPVPPGAVGAVHDGVRRHRATTRAVFATSAVVAVLLGATAVVAGSGLPHKAGLALGGDEPTRTLPPSADLSASPSVTKAPRPEHIPWTPRPYDVTHALAVSGSIPDPGVPSCTAGQLVPEVFFEGATGSMAGSFTVTNDGSACGMQGVPNVVGLDASGATIALSQPADDFAVHPWVRLEQGDQAIASLQIFGDGSRCLGVVDTLSVELGEGAQPLTVSTADGLAQPRCGTVSEARQTDHYDVGVGAWRSAGETSSLPGGALSPSLQRVAASVMQGTFLRYQVNADADTAGERPCRPFRERLVRGDGTVVAEATYLLPCPAVRAASSESVYLDMQLYVPTNVATGEMRLEWETPDSERVVAPVRVTAAPPQCEQQQLQVTGYANGAAGSLLGRVIFTNVSGGECSLFGYPGIEFVSRNGQHLPTTTYKQDWPKATVPLRPGDKASFLVSTAASKPPTGEQPCRDVSGIDVIAPGLFQQVLVRDVARYCLDGKIDVWPVVAGTHWHP